MIRRHTRDPAASARAQVVASDAPFLRLVLDRCLRLPVAIRRSTRHQCCTLVVALELLEAVRRASGAGR